MKTFTTAEQNAIRSGAIVPVAFARFNLVSGYYGFHTWVGPITPAFTGDPAGLVYIGVGSLGALDNIQTTSDGSVTGLELTLSGVPGPVLATFDADEDYHQRPVTIFRALMDQSYASLIATQRVFVGRIDYATREDGGDGQDASAKLRIQLEGGPRRLQGKGGRRRTDTDQRRLSGSTDTGMSQVAYAGERTRYWGQNVGYTGAGGGGGVTKITTKINSF